MNTAARLARLLVLVVFAAPSTDLPAQVADAGLSGVRGRAIPAAIFGVEDGSQFGQVIAAGDFNGDGADDLATGIPRDDRSGVIDSGAVLLRLGIPSVGFVADVAVGVTVLHQGLAGSPDPLDPGDRFGAALASCDFNGDGFDDLAIGIPGEAGPGTSDTTGAVEVFLGSGTGIGSGSSLQFFSPLVPGIPGEDHPETLFGETLACGDFDGDGIADLAIGAPAQRVPVAGGSLVAAGSVVVLYGSAGALDPSGAIGIDQGLAGVVGTPEAGDRFGSALAVGDFFGDGVVDLAVGMRKDGTGAVHLFGGQAGLGITPAENVLLDEAGVGGTPSPNDWMGFSLAAGDFEGDGHDELAIGIPFEDFVGADAGGVIVVDLVELEVSFWSQTSIHGGGSSESGDRFGLSLASGDFDDDGFDDLAVGAPGESAQAAQDGQVSVVMGSETGLTAARRRGLRSGAEGLPGVPNQAGRNYGHAVATGDFDGDGSDDLAIGSPLEDSPSRVDVGAEVVLFGSLHSDGFESGDTAFWSSDVP